MSRLLLVRPTASGGLDAHADHEQRLLREDGWDVTDAGVRISSRPRPAADLRAVRILRRAARRADAVHAHGLRAGALAALALGPARGAGALFVVTVHNRPVGSAATRAVGAVLLRILATRADVVLGVSPDLVAAARAAGARRAEPAVIPAPRRASPASGAAPERSLGPDDPLRALVLARLAPQKGLEDLLDAVLLLHEQRVPVQVDIAGEGPLRSRLAMRIADENLPVRLLGRRHDVAQLLAHADVVVSAARWEGQPLALQEALIAGRPLIATDAGGTRWVTGTAADLVPVGDPAALAARIRAHRDAAVRTRAARASRERARSLPDEAQLRSQLHALLTPPDPRMEENA